MAKRKKAEERQQSSYTDLILQARLDGVTAGALKPTVTAVVESCAGVWERAFSAAVADMLSPPILAMVGRALLLRGEFVGVRLDGDLCPVAHWDIHGSSPTPMGWRYRLDVQAPDGMLTVRASGRDVFHPRVGVRPEDPWRGRSPLANMPESIRLLANLEVGLADELSGPTGHIIPVPSLKAASGLGRDIQNLKGRATLGETTQAAWGAGGGPMGSSPSQDWRPQRIGPQPVDATVNLRQQVSQTILAAAGVPVELIHHADGGGAREAWRRFLHSTIAPVGAVVGAEAARALGASGMVSFDNLFASDLTGRARAYQSLTGGGMEEPTARRICGF